MRGGILVVGGAGYIGAHTAMALEAAGYDVTVFDNLSTGHREFLKFGRHVVGDLGNPEDLDRVFAGGDIDTVMHFAAFINVGESVSDPAKYYRNNVCNTLNLLEAMRRHGVGSIIFSSTCAIYGIPRTLPLTEDHAQTPINPYGRTKLAIEWLLEDFSRAYGLRYCSLRYFNAAGAAPVSCGIGEWHEPETHLIPLILRAALDASRRITVFGTDYDTKDGTCIRDYIHVSDLADAHIRAMKHLQAGGESGAFNLGNGQGYSVLEMIEAARKVTGRDIAVTMAGRRAGDPPVLVGDSRRAMAELGWKAEHSELANIMKSAWEWEQKLSAQRSKA